MEALPVRVAVAHDGGLNALNAEVDADRQAGRSERASRAYGEQWGYFERWCAANGYRPGPKTGEGVMVAYIDHLRLHGGRDGTGAAVASLRLVVAAIRDRNGREGYEDWPPRKAASALIRRQHCRFTDGPDRRPVKARTRLDGAGIAELAEKTPDNTVAGLRDHMILCLKYWTEARPSELIAYRVGDLAFEREGQEERLRIGGRPAIEDPVTIDYARRYLAVLAEYGQDDPDMPLLRGVTKNSGLTPVTQDGAGLTGKSVNRILKRMISRAAAQTS